jgi:hypothetical protein
LATNITINTTSTGMSGFVQNALANTNNIKTVTQTAFDGTKETTELFILARNNAKLTGKLLGHFLAHNVLFDT